MAASARRRAPLLRFTTPSWLGLACTVLVLLQAGCASRTFVVQHADAAALHGRSLLMLDATPAPPLPEDQLRRVIGTTEAELLASPQIGSAISRAQFRQRFKDDFTILSEYGTLSDSVAQVGLPERQLVLSLGRKSGVELLFSLQAFYITCPQCDQGDQGALVALLLDARTSKLMWRTTLIYDHLPGVERSQEVFDAMSREVVDEFNQALTYKWQRQRFEHLRGKAS